MSIAQFCYEELELEIGVLLNPGLIELGLADLS
jgi:hypothetical protein